MATRGLRFLLAGVLTAGLLAALASVGAVSYAANAVQHSAKHLTSSKPSGNGGWQRDPAFDQYGRRKVTICHKGKTISVSRSAVPAHRRHGDTVGPCPSSKKRKK